MKSNLTKVSLALLSAVFVLGCQDVGMGVVASDGAGPQFDKRGDPGALCGGAGGPVRDEKGHCHGDEETTEGPVYTVKVTSVTNDIFSVGTNITDGEVDGLYEASGFGPQTMGFRLNISSILDGVTCGVDDVRADLLPLSDALPDPLIGNFTFGDFLDDYIVIFFNYMGAEHHFLSPAGVGELGELPETWPPTGIGQAVEVKDLNGEWTMYTKGRNHQKGCTGEGGPASNNPIKWTATVTRIS